MEAQPCGMLVDGKIAVGRSNNHRATGAGGPQKLRCRSLSLGHWNMLYHLKAHGSVKIIGCKWQRVSYRNRGPWPGCIRRRIKVDAESFIAVLPQFDHVHAVATTSDQDFSALNPTLFQDRNGPVAGAHAGLGTLML